jgi:hypothetical protein
MFKLRLFLAVLSVAVLIACSGNDSNAIEVGVSVSDAENVNAHSAFLSVHFFANNSKIKEVGCIYSTVKGKLNVNAFENYDGYLATDFGIISASPSVSGIFICEPSDLLDNTTYYVMPYIRLEEASDEFYQGYFLPAEYKEFTTLYSSEPYVKIDNAMVTSHSAATLYAAILKIGEPAYTEKGICYGRIRNPAKGNSTCVEEEGTDLAYLLSVSDLSASTTYYARAYISNEKALVQYSREIEFKTWDAPTVPIVTDSTLTDRRDGKVYRIKTFGSYTWMIDDIRYNSSTGAYTWEQAIAICPSGWHLPTYNEWNFLTSSAASYFANNGHYWSSEESGDYYAYHWYRSYSDFYRSSASKKYTYYVRCVRG